MMNNTNKYYNILVDDVLVAERVPLNYALIFIKAIQIEFQVKQNLNILVERV